MKTDINFLHTAAKTVAVTGLLALASCGGNGEFGVKGEVEGAQDQPVVVQRADFSGRWADVDSTRTDAQGRFSISLPLPAAPDIYRLDIAGNYVYLPVDTLKAEYRLEGALSTLGRAHRLSGTPAAERLAAFDREAAGLHQASAADPDTLNRFKRKVYAEIIQPGQGDLLSYYVLTKTVDGKPVFDPQDPQDVNYIGAVATAYEQYNPTDPHAEFLRQLALAARRNRAEMQGKRNVMEVNELAFPEIVLKDATGTERRLSETVGNGKPTLLVFSLLESPEFNKRLGSIYGQKGQRINIYQVGYDDDVHVWKDAAEKMPWINVYDPAGGNSRVLVDYNVEQIPQFYIFNSRGELTDKAYNFETLNELLGGF